MNDSLHPDEIVSGKYKIVCKESEEDKTETYLATQIFLSKKVALELIKSAYAGDATVVLEFQQKARSLQSSKTKSAHGALIDFGLTEDFRPYIVYAKN